MKTFFLWFAAIAMAGELAAPKVGVMAGADGTARTVEGIAGAFVPGEVLAPMAKRVASSGRMTVIGLDRRVRLGSGEEFDAPTGDAIFGFDGEGTTTYAYYAASRSLLRIRPDGTEVLLVDADLLAGEVVALSGALTAWVRREDGIHAVGIRLGGGAVEADTAAGFDAMLLVALGDGRVVYGRGAMLVVRDRAGGERELEAPGPVQYLGLMGAEWVQVRAGGQSLALRVRSGGESLYWLPEVPE